MEKIFVGFGDVKKMFFDRRAKKKKIKGGGYKKISRVELLAKFQYVLLLL